MLLSIVSISLALASFLIYNAMMLIATTQINDIKGWNLLYLNTDKGVNFRLSIDQLKVMFTFSAFVFDLYKWCVFIVATKQNVISEEISEQRERKMVYILYTLQSLIAVIFMTFFFTIWLTHPDSQINLHFRRASRYSVIALFASFFIVYVTVLFILIKSLKRYFPKFYLKEKNKILIANGSIIISIISRITVNLWYL